MLTVQTISWHLQTQCKRQSAIPFRLNRPHPEPPTLEQWKAAPKIGTEKILRDAFKRKWLPLPQAGHLKRKKMKEVPWILDVEFDSDEELWLFVDGLETLELRRQRVKFGLPNHQQEESSKKALFLLVKHQEFYQQEADEIMERRIIRANQKAERRARNRLRRAQKKEKKKRSTSILFSPDPFCHYDDEDDDLSWLGSHQVEPIAEINRVISEEITSDTSP